MDHIFWSAPLFLILGDITDSWTVQPDQVMDPNYAVSDPAHTHVDGGHGHADIGHKHTDGGHRHVNSGHALAHMYLITMSRT